MDGTVPGLTVRLGPNSATWSLQLRVTGEGGVTNRGHRKTGRKYRITLGEYPTVTIEAARGLANTYLDQAKRGMSPIKALESAASANGLTIEALGTKFLEDYVRMKELRAVQKYENALRVHIVPRIGGVLCDVLTREQVRELVKSVMTKRPRGSGGRDRPRGGKEAARTVVGLLRKMLGWASKEELITRKDNPVAGMESNLPKKKEGNRVLSLREARAAWKAARTLGYPFGPIYQLILLTGCRPGEWSECMQSFLDLDQALMIIPANRCKSGHVHVVPLVTEAVQILNDVLAQNPCESGPYIFSGTDGRKPLAGWPRAQARILRAICAETGEIVKNSWTPHDLRRTVAARIAEQLGVGGEQFIKKVLGHLDGSVTAIYNRYGYVKETRAVLEQWVRDLTADESSVAVMPRLVA
jgi:integrase